MSAENIGNFNGIITSRVEQEPDALAYSFLTEKAQGEIRISFAELDRAIRCTGAALQRRDLRGKRVLLALAHGPAFIYAFYSCLALGAIAVPVVPPSKNKKNLKLQAVLLDAAPSLILTDSDLIEVFQSGLEYSAGERPDIVDFSSLSAAAESFEPVDVSGDEIAFLQYTSGSTGDPKGVMVSHGNLMANSALISAAAQTDVNSKAVIWLPFYHDMGLIGGVLQSMFVGTSTHLISPVSFIQKPIRWLQLMSEQRSTIAVAPNFALELCCDKVTDEQMASLDLSSLHCVFCGAEPVNPKTVQRFSEKFAACGFRHSAFMPSYGLAEATLYVSGALQSDGPTVLTLDAASLAVNKIVDSQGDQNSQSLVSNGELADRVKIVDPESLLALDENQIGEIWVRGESVAQGYWQRPELNSEVFGATLASDPAAGSFYRTGDLGFHRGGELYINGRIKDLIIIRAKNHYPQDIEDTVTRSHELLTTGAAAAFSVDRGFGEELVLVLEVGRSGIRALKDEKVCAQVIDAVLGTLSAQHELFPAEIMILKPGRVLRTSSGKIQRNGNKQAWIAGSLEPVHRWAQQKPALKRSIPSSDSSVQIFANRADIENWLLGELSVRSGVERHEIALDRSFSSYGLDSLAAIELVGEINLRLEAGSQIDPTELWNYSTVESLLDYLKPQKTEERNAEPEDTAASTAPSKGSEEESDLAAEVAALRALLGD